MREFRVFGRRYSEVPNYAKWDAEHEYPNYESIEETETEWTIVADDLEEAEKWLAENHPEYFMGSFIQANDGSEVPDFSANAVPCEFWGEGNYETEERRIATVREWVNRERVIIEDSEIYDDYEDEWFDEEESDEEEFVSEYDKYEILERKWK